MSIVRFVWRLLEILVLLAFAMVCSTTSEGHVLVAAAVCVCVYGFVCGVVESCCPRLRR